MNIRRPLGCGQSRCQLIRIAMNSLDQFRHHSMNGKLCPSLQPKVGRDLVICSCRLFRDITAWFVL